MKRIVMIASCLAGLCHADIIYTFSDTFSASTPATTLSAPNSPFTLTFEVPETPVPASFVSGTRFDYVTPATLTFGANVLTFASLDFSFFAASSDGGFSVSLVNGSDSADFITASAQLYSGSEQFPVMLAGAFNVPVGAISRVDVGQVGQGSQSYFFTVDGTISGITTTPEPATTGAVAAGAMALLFLTRSQRVSRRRK